MKNARLEQLQKEIEPLREQIKNHAIYSEIKTLEDLKIFMENHVFAVWDFMSALKVLQQKLTSIHVPWIPKGNPNTRFLINSIVLEEESGLDQDGNRLSHYELYLNAMKQAGCNTDAVTSFLHELSDGQSFSISLDQSTIPDTAKKFIKNTIQTSIHGDKLHVQAAVFTFGRRNLLPDMFKSLVDELEQKNPKHISIFNYYLSLNASGKKNNLSTLAQEMTLELCGTDEKKWEEATNGVNRSLLARIQLWDSILEKIKEQKGSKANKHHL
ncbi:heme oxygenase [Sphingobacteriaceae bacterium]|nr:heme oxygenase [Sphingobacteriaceae bacterium]